WPEAEARPGDERLRPGLVLRTHPEALPRLYFLAGGVAVVDDPVEGLLALGDASPLRAMVRVGDLPAGVDAAQHAGAGRTGGAVTVHRNQRTLLSAMVEADGPGLLILNEDPAARWHASLDGRVTPMFRVNGYQVALVVPARGQHAVRIVRPGPLTGRADARLTP